MNREKFTCICGANHEIAVGRWFEGNGWVRCFCGVRWEITIDEAVKVDRKPDRKNKRVKE